MVLKSLVSDQTVPILPYRLKVLAYSKSYWSRVDYYTDHALVAQQQGSYFGDIVMESLREGSVSCISAVFMMLVCCISLKCVFCMYLEKLVSCVLPQRGVIINISQLLESEGLQK